MTTILSNLVLIVSLTIGLAGVAVLFRTRHLTRKPNQAR